MLIRDPGLADKTVQIDIGYRYNSSQDKRGQLPAGDIEIVWITHPSIEKGADHKGNDHENQNNNNIN
jgi:hypothetical protein